MASRVGIIAVNNSLGRPSKMLMGHEPWPLRSSVVLSLVSLACGSTVDAPLPWRPRDAVKDSPFVQEVSERVGELAEVTSIASGPAGELYAVAGGRLVAFDGSRWVDAPKTVTGTIVAVAFDPFGRRTELSSRELSVGDLRAQLPDGVVAQALRAREAGGFWVVGRGLAARFDGELVQLPTSTTSTVVGIIDLPEGPLIATTHELIESSGLVTAASSLGVGEVRGVARTRSGTLWVGGSIGVARRRGGESELAPFSGEDGLHFANVRSLVSHGDDLWISTSFGASRYSENGSRRLYVGRTWLPSDDVRAVEPLEGGGAWFATADGVSKLEPRLMSLAEKATHFDEITERRHVRMGFTSTENHLREPGDVSTSFLADDDNDGQWTAMYLASQCFRYAASGSARAKDNAVTAAKALMRLEAVTGLPGFFARSIITRDECGDPTVRPGEWHVSADGESCWKGDTSSDELVGHVFGLSLFHDLVADAPLRDEVRQSFTALVRGLIDNGYKLLDVDGEPTTHGRFDPEWMHNNIVAQFGDAGLNSAMILGALAAAHHMSGDSRFSRELRRLAIEERYSDYVSRIEPINLTVQVNHDSEEMSFLALYTLIRYEQDPALRTAWRKGLDGLWDVQRPERNPEFNFMYGALAKSDDPDLAVSVETLRKLPLDLVHWGLDLYPRLDKQEARTRDRMGRRQNAFVFPYDERQPMRWAENPYAYELRGDGRSEASGTFWLLPYWMARYDGFIASD
ncbi:MAG: hypothetical protein HYV07_26385 [Deltaproteobacteria bacterium]|nr:hypothetical protein [Deltaproteobacteria bacterium]